MKRTYKKTSYIPKVKKQRKYYKRDKTPINY